MDLNIGDRVRFLNDVGEGLVTGFRQDGYILVEDDTGFENPYPKEELIVVQNKETEDQLYSRHRQSHQEIIDREVDPEKLKKSNKDFDVQYKNDKATTQRRRGEYMEVDLHSHAILDNERGLDPGELLDIQMRHFERMMSTAEEKRIPRIIFIHGIGKGVLRNEIRKAIKAYYPNAEFHDGSFSNYGQGATEVTLRFN